MVLQQMGWIRHFPVVVLRVPAGRRLFAPENNILNTHTRKQYVECAINIDMSHPAV